MPLPSSPLDNEHTEYSSAAKGIDRGHFQEVIENLMRANLEEWYYDYGYDYLCRHYKGEFFLMGTPRVQIFQELERQAERHQKAREIVQRGFAAINPSLMDTERWLIKPRLWTWDSSYIGVFCTKTFPYGDLVLSTHRPWLPETMEPLLRDVEKYHDECYRLQASEAGRRAKRLLMAHLSDEQIDEYENKGYFRVTSSEGKPYLIERWYPAGNVYAIENGTVLTRYCCHPRDPYPVDDILLTQKVGLETDARGFLAEANESTDFMRFLSYYRLGIKGLG